MDEDNERDATPDADVEEACKESGDVMTTTDKKEEREWCCKRVKTHGRQKRA